MEFSCRELSKPTKIQLEIEFPSGASHKEGTNPIGR
jgi:hypothetical protein